MSTCNENRSPSGISEQTKPALLAVAGRLPWPLNSLGQLRSFHLLRSMTGEFTVRLLAPCTPEEQAHTSALREHGIEVLPAPLGASKAWQASCRGLFAAARGEPYLRYPRYNCRAVRRLLKQVVACEPPDVVYLDRLEAFAYQRLTPDLPVVADFHDVPSRLTLKAAAAEKRCWLRRYLLREARLLYRRERFAANRADIAFAPSAEACDYFSALGARDARVIPNGVDCQAYAALPTGRADRSLVILYAGPMSQSPDSRAATFLAREVLPKVRTRFPRARLRIVGRAPTPAVCALTRHAGVEVVAADSGIASEFADAHVLATPAESADSVRQRILEAFAAGLPVVSTKAGCEGMGAADNEQLRIADRRGFAGSIISLFDEPSQGRRWATAARKFVREEYDWRVIGAAAVSAARSAMTQDRQSR